MPNSKKKNNFQAFNKRFGIMNSKVFKKQNFQGPFRNDKFWRFVLSYVV